MVSIQKANFRKQWRSIFDDVRTSLSEKYTSESFASNLRPIPLSSKMEAHPISKCTPPPFDKIWLSDLAYLHFKNNYFAIYFIFSVFIMTYNEHCALF